MAINQFWVAANYQDVAMGVMFGIGYAYIIFEESLRLNKSAIGLLMAVSLWVVRSVGAPSREIAVSELTQATAEVSEIVFFLVGAMTIVEIVDAHQGFKLVTDNITTRKPRTLLWVIGLVAFLLSSILDNLTTTILMVSLLRKLIPPSEYRKLLGAVVVIAANSGGAWSPIGDVTTTMLWIHGQISTLPTIKNLIIPSAVSLAVPLALLSLTCKFNEIEQDSPNVLSSEQMAPRGLLVLSVAIGALVFVPVFKGITGLPPFMGMLLGLGVLWILTDAIHYGESDRQKLKVPQALSQIDTQGVLFFLGILLSVSSLEAAGILGELANYLDAHIPNPELIASAIGVASAIVDNVPLVAATMGMYDLTTFPQDSEFWQLVAYCAGTGGSMLIIGSPAGVAYMGMEKVDLFWYLRKVSGVAFVGYAAGIAAYLAIHNLNVSLSMTVAQETSTQDFEATYQPKADWLKALAVLAAAAATGTMAINQFWVAAIYQDVAMGLLFVIGYACIIFEEYLGLNKSGVGLLMAVSLWVVRSIGAPSREIAVSELTHASAEVSEIVFFLVGAMTIVEIVDAHLGFKLVTDKITTRKPGTLLWVIGLVTFLLSSVLDNLTTTIVMVSLLRKLVPPSEYRKLLGAVVVIAANAGGAWTPIGDVTTTMLWIHGQITTLPTMKNLIIPSAVSLAVPLALLLLGYYCSFSKSNKIEQDSPNVLSSEQMAPRGLLVFSVAIGALVFVPVFKAITGLPPFMGMLLGLGVLWILTDATHYGESDRQKLKVTHALSRIDTQGVLFFLGILLSVRSLEAAGILRKLANYLDAHIPNSELIASAIGIVSAIIDNVPLVAGTMGMYDLTSFPQDSKFWQLVALCASTGGSMLVIGSAAGVAYMGMEQVDFFWYLRKVSGVAFVGYAAGIAAYLAIRNLC